MVAASGIGFSQPAQARSSAVPESFFCVYSETDYRGNSSCLPETGAYDSPGGPVLSFRGGVVRSIRNDTHIPVCLKQDRAVRFSLPAYTSKSDINVTANSMWFAVKPEYCG
jgi:hypothetical protein